MNFIDRNCKYILFVIPVISFLLHSHVLNRDLVGIHVWRQTETQTVINNFYREDFNIFHPKINDSADSNRILLREFPIMQWVFALFYKIFGGHIFITRLLTFIIGLSSVYGMFYLSREIFGNYKIALLCAWTFNFSPVFYYYTINPLPDNLSLCCAIWSLFFFYKYFSDSKSKYLIISGLFLSLATLAKLPFILYGSVIFSYVVIKLFTREIKLSSALKIFITVFIAIIPALIWYSISIPTWGGLGIIKGITDRKTDLLNCLNILQGTLISVLPESLVNYGSVIFLFAGFYFLQQRKVYKARKSQLLIGLSGSIIIYYLFEINMIDTVHDYYLFPFLPLIFLVVAYGAYNLLNSEKKFLKYLALFALVILPLTAFIRADSRWGTKDPGFNPVYYQCKKQLRQITPPNALCVVGNDDSHYILLYYIDRKGWAFDHDHLDGSTLSYYIRCGAKYLFIDDGLDSVDGIKMHLDQRIFINGNVRAYKLK